jgi:hypothetical protein
VVANRICQPQLATHPARANTSVIGVGSSGMISGRSNFASVSIAEGSSPVYVVPLGVVKQHRHRKERW